MIRIYDAHTARAAEHNRERHAWMRGKKKVFIFRDLLENHAFDMPAPALQEWEIGFPMEAKEIAQLFSACVLNRAANLRTFRLTAY